MWVSLRTHCHNKWHQGTLEVSTPQEVPVGTHFPGWHATKTTLVFVPGDGKASGLPLPSLVSLLSGDTVRQENTYSCIIRMTRQVWASQQRIGININHSYHQGSSPKVSLDWSNNLDSVITNPISTFSQLGKTDPAGHQRSISMSPGKKRCYMQWLQQQNLSFNIF